MVGRHRSHFCLITDCRYIGVDLHRIPSEASEGDLFDTLLLAARRNTWMPPASHIRGTVGRAFLSAFVSRCPSEEEKRRSYSRFGSFFFSFFSFWPLLKNILRLLLLDGTTAWIGVSGSFWVGTSLGSAEDLIMDSTTMMCPVRFARIVLLQLLPCCRVLHSFSFPSFLSSFAPLS